MWKSWGIGLLEVILKVVEAIIDTQINMVVMFHSVLHLFCASRGMGTAIMELNMAHELTIIYQYPLLLVFLYLREIIRRPIPQKNIIYVVGVQSGSEDTGNLGGILGESVSGHQAH